MTFTHRIAAAAVVAVLLCVSPSFADEQADAELAALSRKVPFFRVIDLPAGPGELVLVPDQTLTVDDLRDIALDDSPPVAGPPQKPYPTKMTGEGPLSEAPYFAHGIRPFRFRYFNNEFNYGGWHNFRTMEYASTHGFSIIYPYNRFRDYANLPAGTRYLRWGGFVNWERWLEEHEIGPLRYDHLAGRNLVDELLEANVFKSNAGLDSLMIDLEHPLLLPDKLRQQTWYPTGASSSERDRFEKQYYDGYAQTYIAPVEAARQRGWQNISLYGWQPFARKWGGLDKARVDPATDWAWNAFGKSIYESVDILNPSVYCFYWSPQNVAYTLANIDLNQALVQSMPSPKPVRPYYWTLLHGGGGGWRWWRNQPLANAEVRAMTVMCFFTGCDGLVLWNWSGTGSHHEPPPLKKDADVMVARPFWAKSAGAARTPSRQIERHDVLHIVEVDDDGTVRFQRVYKDLPGRNYRINPDQPVYGMPASELRPYLRPSSQPVAAMIEGLALVKPLEYLLRHGEVRIDVPAQEQFAQRLPIVRRVQLGEYHVIATYDPVCAYGGEPRSIELEDFAGRGIKLVLPADDQTRIFVVRAKSDS